MGADAIRWFVPKQQPIRRDFGVLQSFANGRSAEISTRDKAVWPFCVLSEFSSTSSADNRILVVAPLSGHFAFILREMVAELVRKADVSVTDWLNAGFVPLSEGEFGFDENIDTIMQSIKRSGPDLHVIALCQGVVPALAATALLAQYDPANTPRSLILMGGPVDPIANPTRVVRLLRQRSLKWIETNALDWVGPSLPGAERRVYPARHQLLALFAYFFRHVMSDGEVLHKVLDDDGLDPAHFPFLELFTALMDLPAQYFLENIQKVFLDREPWTIGLNWYGKPVDFGAIQDTALMTIEGELDDIAAPGQTSAAHRLCPNIPDSQRHKLILDGAGHFSLFYGKVCRYRVVPEITAFMKFANDTRRRGAHREASL
jgi:poly(3-hydroxybutyrate) depolymerase